LVEHTAPWPCKLFIRRLMPDRYDDPESLKLVHDWMGKCAASHGFCHVPQIPPSLPTRVLDLGAPPSDLESWYRADVRLTEGRFGSGRYVCLSHCWGNPSYTLKTTIQNQHQYFEEISCSNLPPLFQDAVLFSRKLGIQYLWIDSLCIIQEYVTLIISLFELACVTWSPKTAGAGKMARHVGTERNKVLILYNTVISLIGIRSLLSWLQPTTMHGSHSQRSHLKTADIPFSIPIHALHNIKYRLFGSMR